MQHHERSGSHHESKQDVFAAPNEHARRGDSMPRHADQPAGGVESVLARVNASSKIAAAVVVPRPDGTDSAVL
jgi:hypothetical protein